MSDAPDTLLIVEDDPGLRRQLQWSFANHTLVFAEDRAVALTQLRRHEPQVVLLDLGLPPAAEGASEGMRALAEMLRLAPATKIIVVTGNTDESNALHAVSMGAYDFYQKPVDTKVLGLIIERAFHIAGLEEQNRNLRKEAARPLAGLIAASDVMQRVVRQVEKIAPTSATTLLHGETGTGKELVARALHRLGSRAEQNFSAINCAAIPETLLDSELFGHEKGAFTGAQRRTLGKIEVADGGTLFLDEIGDMAPALQAKLLRFLQERVIERVGGRQEIAVDVRVLCATHQDLRSLAASGAFREDLYYRIAEITIEIPPLRDRTGDAVLMAKVFLERAAAENHKALRGFTPGALLAISDHDWPGNVRELEHRINRAVILAEGSMITLEDMGLGDSKTAGAANKIPINLRAARDHAERLAVQKSLECADGNLSEAARLLGISRPALYGLLRKQRGQA